MVIHKEKRLWVFGDNKRRLIVFKRKMLLHYIGCVMGKERARSSQFAFKLNPGQGTVVAIVVVNPR